jgi:Ser/Thr protein kinase RdoA (MazF antagonist)
MMTLGEINGLERTVDTAGQSSVADAVAARWGYPAGAARWWRSSASHVFVLPESRAFLRFVPGTRRSHDELAGVAELMQRLADRGVAVVRPRSSAGGALVETVDTDLGPMHAMCVAAAAGRQLEVDVLTLPQARAWGTELARLHETAAEFGDGLPVAFAELEGAAALFANDPPLVAAVQRLIDRLNGLPRDPSRYGVIHGDFELDNLAWVGDSLTSFDFDDAARSWFAADIALAVRDLTSAGTPTPTYKAHFDAFLAGYRDRRPLPERDIADLPLFAAAATAARLITLQPVLHTTEPDPLHTKLTSIAAADRRALLES